MPQGSDQTYLLTEQYHDASNLTARIRLHARFSTNRYGWNRWLFDQLRLDLDARILELGCGPGHLWRENRERISEGWEVTLTDFSAGMLQEARGNLGGGRPFRFMVVDAQAIPFPEASFDAVIANHMLYHVPDRAKALSEIRRVLRPGGRFYASTVGRSHMRELREMIGSAGTDSERWTEAFNLEDGQEELSRWFSRVTCRRYEDVLVVTEAEPLLAYALSGANRSLLVGERLAEFTRLVEGRLASDGAIRITKDSGLFEAE